MPRRVIGPFKELKDFKSKNAADLIRLVHDVLEAEGCNCNGAAAGNQRDHYWNADISQLVNRCNPHLLSAVDKEGKQRFVSLRLDTLRVEVDDNNEVCAWLYSETE